jgi:hypothetical protein
MIGPAAPVLLAAGVVVDGGRVLGSPPAGPAGQGGPPYRRPHRRPLADPAAWVSRPAARVLSTAPGVNLRPAGLPAALWRQPAAVTASRFPWPVALPWVTADPAGLPAAPVTRGAALGDCRAARPPCRSGLRGVPCRRRPARQLPAPSCRPPLRLSTRPRTAYNGAWSMMGSCARFQA